ncbi:MAG: Dam family site-specific DNA-(adenine-N6)-methyltransferase [Candidatus Shapirobacteria bacterium]|jgi:DNA adenine methylase
MNAKPFIKWVGGKGKLIPELEKYLPKKFTRYYEPFVGGGALFFSLKQSRDISFASINDINRKLITAYKQIQQNPKELISLLGIMESNYKKLSFKEQEKDYYKKREIYNNDKLNKLNTTAYLIFLNKTCFNGMYRENSKGQYNIPFGDQKNPTICDRENILAVSNALKNTEITDLAFEESVNKCKKGDFIYFDPPYCPLNATSNFTSYSKSSFGPEEQRKLRDIYVELANRGCFIMLSNSNAPLVLDLYKKYKKNIHEVYAARSINSKGNKRGKIKEVVITSYTI